MNYIGDDFEWDKLVVICYPPGFGGDFLCNLLQINYDPNYTFFPNEKNKFEWTCKNPEINSLFSFQKKYNGKLDISFDIKDEFKYCFETIYDKDFDTFKKNYIQFIRNKYMENYLKNDYIINFHYHNAVPIEKFSINEVFPKASIFFLYSENKEYNFLFKILELIKKTNISYSTNIKKDISTIVVNSRIYAHTQTFDNMIGIDVGKLFFEDGYEEEIEKKLSKQLNKEIILDRNVLEKYKKTNRDIIEKYMEISNIHGLSCEEIVQTILGNFFIDERNYMDDEKFKFLLKKWNLLI